MKKFLALVLALVMTFSLVTISAGAEDFTDADSVTYEEAVDVMTAIGVVGGYADGSFNPTAGLTRGAAAKIICNMLLGPTTAEALVANEAPFSDVAVDNVFAGYIAYCVNEGIISGYADGTFKPAAPLTGYAFMKMLLGALGYDAAVEGYVGTNWSIQVAKRALNIGLDDGLVGDFAGAKALTREEACLYAFNALTSNMVKYDNSSTIKVGDIVITNNSKAEPVAADVDGSGIETTNYTATDATTAAGNGYVQFCEQYFSKLELTESEPDAFDRPAHGWDYKGNDVGEYANDAAFVYTGATTAKTIAADMKGYYFENSTTKYKVENDTDITASTVLTDVANNVSTTTYAGSKSTATSAIGGSAATVAEYLESLTGNGKLVEIYASSDKEITKIVVVGYAVTKVTAVSTAANGDVTYSLTGLSALKDYANEDKEDDLDIDGTIAKNDYVTYTKSPAADATYFVYPTEKVVATQSAFNTLKETLTLDGAVYTVGTAVYGAVASSIAVDFPNTDKNYNYYVDQYGFVVESDAVATETKYAVVNQIIATSGLTEGIKAELAFSDGTVEEVVVKDIFEADGTTDITITATTAATVEDCEGMVFTYSVKDDKYTLTAATYVNGTRDNTDATLTGTDGDYASQKGQPTVAGVGTVYNDTKFLVKTLSGTDEVFTAYTGFKSIPTVQYGDTESVVVDYATKDGRVSFVYIDATIAYGMSSSSDKGDIVYITSAKFTTERIDDDTTIYHYAAIINGVEGTLTTTDDAANALLTVGLYKATVVEGDYVKTLVAQSAGNFVANDDYKAFASLTQANCTDAKEGVITVNSTTYTYDGTETVYVVDASEGTVAVGAVEGLLLNTNTTDYSSIYVKEIDNSTAANEIEVMYVVVP